MTRSTEQPKRQKASNEIQWLIKKVSYLSNAFYNPFPDPTATRFYKWLTSHNWSKRVLSRCLITSNDEVNLKADLTLTPRWTKWSVSLSDLFNPRTDRICLPPDQCERRRQPAFLKSTCYFHAPYSFTHNLFLLLPINLCLITLIYSQKLALMK
jgi:hypothetical protein